MKKKLFNKIIIIRTDRIGEVLLSTSAIDSIKKKYPDSKISFMTSEYSKPLLEGRGDIEKIFTVDTYARKGMYGRALRLSKLLKKEEFDTAIIMNPHKMLHLACFLAGIPNRVGFDRKWGFLLNIKKPDDRNNGQKHEVQYTMDLLRLIEGDLETGEPKIIINEKTHENVKEKLSRLKVDTGKPVLAIHPGSSNLSKIWGMERYADLIKKIKSNIDCNIIVLGTEGERAITSYIIKRSGVDVIDLTGKLDLKELACILSNSALFIGNDAGPMHIAAALNIPVIAIFGRNRPGLGPRRWGPWSTRSIVFHQDPGCRPCQDIKCINDYKCMKMVTIDMVFDAVLELLGPWA